MATCIGRMAAACIAAAVASATPQGILIDSAHQLVPGAGVSTRWSRGDVDGDSDTDLVRGEALLLNDGGGVFELSPCSPVADLLSGGQPALGDLDGDGDLDLLVARSGAERLWRNDGAGCWSDASALLPPAVGPDATDAIALFDVDGDADLDAVLADRAVWMGAAGRLRLWINDGVGGFGDASWQIASSPDDPCGFATGDVDGDGDLDLLVLHATESGLGGVHHLLLNNGVGVFTLGVAPVAECYARTSAALVDLDGDADLDLLVGDGVLWRNDGAGGFVDAGAVFGPPPLWFAWADVGDIDGDGDLDPCFGVSSGGDRLFLNDGFGAFAPAAGFPPDSAPSERVDLLDLDGDGDLDLLRHRQGQVQVLFGDGAGSFAAVPPLIPTPPERTWALATGDVDGDGFLDVLAGVWGQSRLLLNRGNGEFIDATAQLPVEGWRTCGVALRDVDGDGDLDALLANGGDVSGQPEELFLNDGAGTFSAAPPGAWTTPADRSYALAAGDVDGDGDVDAFVGNALTRDRLYFNDGAGVFAEQAGAFPAAVHNTQFARLADLDGDGDPDLVTLSGTLRLFVNGGGVFQPAPTSFPPSTLVNRGLDAGDLDGDGDLDVVHGSSTPPYIQLWRNDGAYAFTDVSMQITAPAPPPSALSLVDLDVDGDLDLVAGAPLAFWRNDGQGVFTPESGVLPAASDWPNVLLFEDLDRDGDLDALLGHASAPARALINVSRHVLWRTPPRIGRTLLLDLYGPPGASWALIGSHGRTLTPFGPAGSLMVRRGESFVRTGGVFDPQGRASFDWNVPHDPLLVGREAYWQLVHRPPLRASNLEITAWIDP